MNFLAKVVALPALVVAVALAAAFAFVWVPHSLTRSQEMALLGILLAALVLLVLATWFSVAHFVRRPLKALLQDHGNDVAAPTPAGSGEVAAVADTIARLRDELQRTRAAAADKSLQLEHAVKGLHESEQRYALAVRGASEGIWEWDIVTSGMDLSPRWKAMLGFAHSDLSSTFEAWKDRIHLADRAPVEAALQAHLQNQTSRFESEHRLLRRDGSSLWVLSRGTAIRHANGKAYRMVGLDTDISQFKRMEETLLHVAEGTSGATGDAFFRSLVQHLAEALEVPIAIVTECVNDPVTRMRSLAYWNRGRFIPEYEYDLAGTPCEKVIQKNLPCHYPRDLARLFPDDPALRGLESYYGIPIADSTGKVLGHLALLDDKAMSESANLTSIYRIFAARAAAEMRRQRVQRVVSDLATGLAALRGEECFRALVKKFCSVVGAREAIVTQCLEDSVKRLRVLAWWRDGRLEANVEYDLAGSSCEETIDEAKICAYASGVGERFPPAKPFGRESYLGVPCFDSAGRVIGHIACFDDKPMRSELPDRAILELFAERAAIELERRRLRETLHELTERVSPLRGEAFFSELAKSLAIVLGVREAFVTECMNFPTTRMHRLAHWKNQEFIAAKDYDLPGAPCEEVIQSGQEIYCPVGTSERWPREKPFGWEGYVGLACRDSGGRVIGHIAIVHDKPMREEPPEWSVLKLIAERTAIELERRRLTETAAR